MTTTATRERPIVFSGPMVQAILDGRKTQTRRLVKPQPPDPDAVKKLAGGGYGWWNPEGSERFVVTGPVWAVRCIGPDVANKGITCPYGRPGDRLWVRETWAARECREYDPSGAFSMGTGEQEILYRAGGPGGGKGEPDYGWKSSIHMPRWASRITLELTGVRVERLQDISEEDANAEGVRDSANYSARLHFARLWDEINGKRAPWSSNPWLWVLEFKRVQNS